MHTLYVILATLIVLAVGFVLLAVSSKMTEPGDNERFPNDE